MMLSRHLEQLQDEQDAEIAHLKIETRAALRAVSPRRLVQRYPFVCVGAALVLGMKVAPAPGRGGSSASGGGAGGMFQSLAVWLKRLLPGHSEGAGPSAPGAAHAAPQHKPRPEGGLVIADVIAGVQTLMAAFERMRPAGGGAPMEIMVADAGTIDANSLAVQLRV